MKFDAIAKQVGHVPYITPSNGRYLYDLIVKHKLTNVLELGIAHGTATCYIAAALDELGEGHVTAVDLLSVKDSFQPSAEEQIRNTGLSAFASVTRMHTGYTWFLHDEIARNTHADRCAEVYDLCIIDGPKNWTIDGAAFFMVDKLLKQGGWLIFDDYDWTYAAANRQAATTDGISHRALSEQELQTAQIREVFELLVKQHPNYGNFQIMAESDWAMAQKTSVPDKTYSIVYRDSTRDVVAKTIHLIKRKLARRR